MRVERDYKMSQTLRISVEPSSRNSKNSGKNTSGPDRNLRLHHTTNTSISQQPQCIFQRKLNQKITSLSAIERNVVCLFPCRRSQDRFHPQYLDNETRSISAKGF